MRATFPIITCDDDSGCDQWTLDWYSALVSNWRELMAPGWRYDPYRPDRPQLCPSHAELSDPASTLTAPDA
jgi:hypothetical protein